MEERLMSIIRLALKYNAEDICFENGNIFVKVDDRMYKVRPLDVDNKMLTYLSYLVNIDLYQLNIQSKQFELDVDGIVRNFKLATRNNLGVLKVIY